MNSLIIFLLLGFSICMVVGLVSLLQRLVSGHPEAMNDVSRGGLIQDQAVEY